MFGAISGQAQMHHFDETGPPPKIFLYKRKNAKMSNNVRGLPSFKDKGSP